MQTKIDRYEALKASQKRLTINCIDLTVANTELLASSQHFRKLSKKVPGVIFQYRLYLDGHSSYPYASEGIRDIYELTPKQVRDDASPIFNMLCPLYYDEFLASIQESARSMQPWYIEYQVSLPKKGPQWLQSQATPEMLEDGSILWHGFVTNINERKLAESELHLATRTFESQEAMMVTDIDNNILRVNAAFTTITGYTSEDVVGQSPSLLSAELGDDDFYAVLWDHVLEFGVWEGEVSHRRKNGDTRPQQLNITSIQDARGVFTHCITTIFDVTKSEVALTAINKLAFYDSLTALPNRRLFMDKISQALLTSAGTSRYGALLFVDIDNFKVLNDTLGHGLGDLFLKQVSRRIAECLSEIDMVGRLDGDQFVILLENLSKQTIEATLEAKAISQKIQVSLNRVYQLGMYEQFSSASIGITLFKDYETNSMEILRQAEIAMYQSKKEGRNTLRFFERRMQVGITTRIQMEHELRQAIEQEQFQLYYQIQVDTAGHPLGAEALIRWNHPENSTIQPIQFIEFAEKTGLIVPIGNWVINAACSQLALWAGNIQHRELTLSINVSAKQLNRIDFVVQIQEAFQRHKVNPKKLKIELTESMLINDFDVIVTNMQALSSIGVTFSLDDFGTGYSSLQYLKKLPLSQLKIDQSFVRDMAENNSDYVIGRTIVMMAHSLGLTVIAEGVETSEQRQCLLDIGCIYFQGYLFGKPMPIDAFESLLNKH